MPSSQDIYKSNFTEYLLCLALDIGEGMLKHGAEIARVENTIERICYANTKRDAAAIDFDDSFIYDQLRLDYDRRSIHCEHFMRDEALAAFRKWDAKVDKVEY